MNAAMWERAKQLLADAAERPEAERERYVLDHCPDPELRRDILAMLVTPVPLSEIVAAGALKPGDDLGPYHIRQLLGRGGMGEVYRALDVRLSREVAIKVLPALFAEDRSRLARFDREAKMLAALNHPHIAQIYGLEESNGVPALVMELVEGDTLADLLGRGPISLNRALAIARQLVETVEAAHEQGIVHRDLKPANIKVRDDGTVKVLDFGLAKASASSGAGATKAIHATQEGMILGTAAYMSPEEVHGQPVDKRTDIWAFGCVLYEMLTGRRAFEGDNVSITLAAVMTKEPDWTTLPSDTPVGVRRLLTRCLKKDPKERLREIGDARADLGEFLTDPTEPGTTLFVRALDQLEVTPLVSSATIRDPFVSPDGQWVGFFDELFALKKVAIT